MHAARNTDTNSTDSSPKKYIKILLYIKLFNSFVYHIYHKHF